MTRLEDRLARLEQRVDEIYRLLAALVEMQQAGAAGQPVPPPAQEHPPTVVSQADAPAAESTLALAALPLVGVEGDPLEIQYHLAQNWARSGRTENLSEFDLAGRNLRNIDLKDARLVRANLSRADLTAARLTRADLSESDLSRTQLARADLARANLNQADLIFSNLSYAKLEGASLRHALLTRANLTGANLGGADLSGAQLNRANLTRANLKDAHLTYRQLASVSTLDGATMPDGRLYDGDPEPYKAG
jgi:hypothetical protein